MDIAEGVHQRRLTHADTLYLRSCKHNAGSIFIHQQEVKLSLFVLDVYTSLILYLSFCHNIPIWGDKVTNK